MHSCAYFFDAHSTWQSGQTQLVSLQIYRDLVTGSVLTEILVLSIGVLAAHPDKINNMPINFFMLLHQSNLGENFSIVIRPGLMNHFIGTRFDF